MLIMSVSLPSEDDPKILHQTIDPINAFGCFVIAYLRP